MKKSKHKPVSHQEVHSVSWQWLETPLGPMLAKWHLQTSDSDSNSDRDSAEIHDDALYLEGLWFKDQKYFPKNAPSSATENTQISVSDNATQADSPKILLDLEQWLSAYFLGDPKAWDLLCTIPLKPQGSDFQAKVWALLLEVPYGQTRTYGQLAKEIATGLNKPNFSAQAVGGAIGRNPISILIPCHRIVGAQGALTGYAGGIDKKTQLLMLEKLG